MNLNRSIRVDIEATGASRGSRTAVQALQDVDNQARRTGGGFNVLEQGGGKASASMLSMGTAARALGGIFGWISVAAFAKQVLDAGVALDSLERSFAAIFGGTDAAQAEFAFLREEANRLGQSFYDLAPQFKQIAAAARGTVLEGEPVHKVFSAITEAATALGLSADQTGGALNALQQMISKGTVQAEELRGQLGERLPGAFQLAARAMGVSTKELGKMLEQGQVLAEDLLPKLAEELHKMYGEAAETTGLESAQSAINKLSEAWNDLLLAFYNGDLAVDAINGLTEVLKIWKQEVELILGPLGEFYRIIDNIDGALERLGQGRMKWTDFAGMNGSELKDALAGTRANLEKEMATLQGKIAYQERIANNSLLRSAASGAQAKVDAYRKTYSELETILLSFEEKELFAANEVLTRTRTVAESKVEISKTEKARLQKLLDNELLTEKQKLDRELEQMRAASMSAVEIEQYKVKRLAEINEKASTAALAREKKLEAEKEAARKKRAALEPYQVTEYEQMNKGDMFYGQAEANKRGLDLLNDSYKKNDELLTEFADKHREIVVGETEFKLEQIELQAEAYRRAGASEVAVEQWAKAEKKRIATDWQTGVLRGLEEVSTGSQNAAQTMEDAVTGAFQGMTDAITDFVMTGKMEFSDFADSIIRDMVRMAIQQSITGPLASAAGGFLSGLFSGGSGASVMPSGGAGLYYSGGHHAGGIVGAEPTFLRAVSPAIFSDAPRFHSGGIVGDEVPIIARQGEGVFTQGQMKAIGGGGMNLVVNIIESQGKGGQSEQRQEDGVNIIDIFFDQIDAKMAQNVNQGRGQTTAAITKTFGLNRSRGALR